MDIEVFFSKDINQINGKFYMTPDGTLLNENHYGHNPSTNYHYQLGQTDYSYYCDSLVIRNNSEVFIPYENYFRKL